MRERSYAESVARFQAFIFSGRMPVWDGILSARGYPTILSTKNPSKDLPDKLRMHVGAYRRFVTDPAEREVILERENVFNRYSSYKPIADELRGKARYASDGVLANGWSFQLITEGKPIYIVTSPTGEKTVYKYYSTTTWPNLNLLEMEALIRAKDLPYTPTLLAASAEDNVAILEYIPGKTIEQTGKIMKSMKYISQFVTIARDFAKRGLQFDYNAANFIIHETNDSIYAIDFSVARDRGDMLFRQNLRSFFHLFLDMTEDKFPDSVKLHNFLDTVEIAGDEVINVVSKFLRHI
jgi:hypothetical protein